MKSEFIVKIIMYSLFIDANIKNLLALFGEINEDGKCKENV